MMFGYRDEFEYLKCAECSCLQIKEIPKNLSKYYPSSYFEKLKKRFLKKQNFWNQFLTKGKKYWLGKQSIIGYLVNSFSSKIEN